MKIRIYSLLVLILFASAGLAQKNEANRPPIIDVHLHVYAKDPRWEMKVANPITGHTMTATTERAHMEATIAEMKKHNVVRAVASADYEAALRWKST